MSVSSRKNISLYPDEWKRLDDLGERYKDYQKSTSALNTAPKVSRSITIRAAMQALENFLDEQESK